MNTSVKLEKIKHIQAILQTILRTKIGIDVVNNF